MTPRLVQAQEGDSMTQHANEGGIMTPHTRMPPHTSAMENPSSQDHPKYGGNVAPHLWSAPAAKALAGSAHAPLSRLRSMPEMRKEEKRVSPHSSAVPNARARAGRYRNLLLVVDPFGGGACRYPRCLSSNRPP